MSQKLSNSITLGASGRICEMLERFIKKNMLEVTFGTWWDTWDTFVGDAGSKDLIQLELTTFEGKAIITYNQGNPDFRKCNQTE